MGLRLGEVAEGDEMTKPELTQAIAQLKAEAARVRCTSEGTALWTQIKRLERERTRRTKLRLIELKERKNKRCQI